jgi:hypothetical protein
MTPTFVAALVLGWIVVSFVACMAVCMASSRFSAKVEQEDIEREHARRLAQGQPRRARRASAARLESGVRPVNVKAG